MANTKPVADWKEIDPATLSDPLKKAYDAYKADYAKAQATRILFEKQMGEAALTAEQRTTWRMVFGYNFGKLSAAIVPAAKTTASKKAVAFDSLKVAA